VPELPDLEYIVKTLAPSIVGRRITDVTIREPIVLRLLLPDPAGFAGILPGKRFAGLQRKGPFLRFDLESCELIVHCMLAGRFALGARKDRAVPNQCFALVLDDGNRLSYGDEKKMGKVYLTAPGSYEAIPGYLQQGIDILSPEFTLEAFESAIEGRRHQARVFIMDQSALSAIGNAYADEILFSAGIHPKTSCISLDGGKRRKLYESIRETISWGISEVENAGQPIDVKVRDHVRVRNRKGEPCPVCGTTIRRVGVLGYDSFYCPHCQPATRKQSIPW